MSRHLQGRGKPSVLPAFRSPLCCPLEQLALRSSRQRGGAGDSRPCLAAWMSAVRPSLLTTQHDFAKQLHPIQIFYKAIIYPLHELYTPFLVKY